MYGGSERRSNNVGEKEPKKEMKAQGEGGGTRAEGKGDIRKKTRVRRGKKRNAGNGNIM